MNRTKLFIDRNSFLSNQTSNNEIRLSRTKGRKVELTIESRVESIPSITLQAQRALEDSENKRDSDISLSKNRIL
jgi:hypothetical protein